MRHHIGRSPARGPFHTRLLEQLESRVLLSSVPIGLPPTVAELPELGWEPECAMSPGELESAIPTLTGENWGAAGRESQSPLALVVTAGTEYTVESGAVLALSTDILGHWNHNSISATVAWTHLSGPGQANFSNPSERTTDVTFDQPGTHQVQVSVSADGITVLGQVQVEATENQANVIRIDQAWLAARGDGPYYLDQQGKTYRLYTDVTTDGTAFAITAQNVVFDLNGHTITYNNASPIVVPNASFENGTGSTAVGWNFANAPSARRFQGQFLANTVYDGDYSLQFSPGTQSGYTESTGTITLEANTTYSLSAMFMYGQQSNPGVKGYVQLVGATTRETSTSGSFWRGFQFVESTFTTGGSPETYTVRAGIVGHASGTLPFYIDDIKVQRVYTYGVALAPRDWYPGITPGVTQYGFAHNSHVRNGRIVQGADGATWGHGVFSFATNNAIIENLNITVHGANASAIYGWDASTNPITVRGNTLTSNVTSITSRDNFHGAVIKGIVGTIQNNVITNGPHAGIVPDWHGSTTNISGNTVSLRARYTNAFAILGTAGSQIYNNTINSGTGDYTSRGIGIASGLDASHPARIYNNTIHVQQLANNQEYGGIPIGGVYGLQAENSHYAEVYGNDVTVYGTTIGYALRMTGSNSNLFIHNNTFRAIANGTGGHAAALSFQEVSGANNRFEDNYLITNDGIIAFSSETTMDLVRSHLTVNTPIGSPIPFGEYWAPGTGIHNVFKFLDTTFADTGSRSYFAAATAGGRTQIYLDWTTTFHVTNVSGTALPSANVVLRDRTGTQVFSGTTDATGRTVARLSEFRIQGTTKTLFNQYSVTASFENDEETVYFDANQVQTIDVEFN